MTTYKSLLDDATKLLYQTCDTPRIDAEVLLQHVTEHNLGWLIAHNDSIVSQQHIKQFYELIAQRQQGQPIAYLTGHKEFWTLDLMVSEAVLIPRPDTEILVEQALQRLPTRLPDKHSGKILDLGTGSGAIALSLAKERPDYQITASDKHADALQVARQNALKHNIKNVTFIQSDWFADIPQQQFDLIASNPPYVAEHDPHLEQGDLRFEPVSALTAKQQGLADIGHIIHQAQNYLIEDGWLLLEHGADQGDAVQQLMYKANYRQIETSSDLAKRPRVTVGCFSCQI